MKKAQYSTDRIVLAGGLVLIVIIIISTFLKEPLFSREDRSTDPLPLEKTSEQNYIYIQPGALQSIIIQGEKPLILDLRDPVSYDIDHIPDSYNIPANILVEYALGSDRSRKVVLVSYGEDQNIAQDGARALVSSGISNYAILSGGFESWERRNFQSVSWGDPTQFIEQSKVVYITPDEARSSIFSNDPPLLLDVRSAELFAQSNIKSSINIPVDELESKRFEISHSQNVIVYGENPLESFRGGSKLFDLSFYKVKTLQGSYDDIK